MTGSVLTKASGSTAVHDPFAAAPRWEMGRESWSVSSDPSMDVWFLEGILGQPERADSLDWAKLIPSLQDFLNLVGRVQQDMSDDFLYRVSSQGERAESLDWAGILLEGASKPVEETVLAEDIELDVVVRLSPVQRWTTRIRVTSVSGAQLPIAVPEELL